MGPKVGRHSLKQPTLNWTAKDKYNELNNLEMAVNNIFMTKSYRISIAEKFQP